MWAGSLHELLPAPAGSLAPEGAWTSWSKHARLVSDGAASTLEATRFGAAVRSWAAPPAGAAWAVAGSAAASSAHVTRRRAKRAGDGECKGRGLLPGVEEDVPYVLGPER